MKRILILVASPRKKGNTAALVDAFCKGAFENGAAIEKIDIGRMPVSGCLECYGCYLDHRGCVIDDVLKPVYEHLDEYDAVVLSGPVFFGNLPAQMKAFIDRLFSCYPGGGSKDSALLMTAEGGEETSRGGVSNLQAARLSYETALHYIRWNISGIVIAQYAESYQGVVEGESWQMAYELGLQMSTEK